MTTLSTSSVANTSHDGLVHALAQVGAPASPAATPAPAATSATTPLRVLVTGGGTGGHINPGLAVVAELRQLRPDLEVVWVGTRERLEARLVPQAGIPIEFIEVSFLKGKGLRGKLASLFRMPRALWQSRRLLRRHRPHLVVGVGGFASGPVALMAALSRIPTAIMEQNARPGMTNRILGRFARRIFVSFEETGRWFSTRKVRYLGNPVRPQLLEPSFEPAPTAGQLRVLVIGGSQGATSLNKVLPGQLRQLAERGLTLSVRHAAGRGRRDEVLAAYGDATFAEVLEYIDDMRGAYGWADLVICRSGASTVAELAALGKAAVYVPFPAAADNHQERNAQAVVEHGGGLMVKDHQLGEPWVVEEIAKLAGDADRLRQMGLAAQTVGRPQAGHDIALSLLELVG